MPLEDILPAAAADAAIVGGSYLLLRRVQGLGRTVICLALSLSAALVPLLIPLDAWLPRFPASLVSITLLVKLFDFARTPGIADALSFPRYCIYCANGFWLVSRRPPPVVSRVQDVRMLSVLTPMAAVAFASLVLLFQFDWSRIPFVIEHVVKVVCLFATIVLGTNILSSAWRIMGGKALTPMGLDVWFPRTPAEFWQNWNRPAQQFFHEYVFRPIARRSSGRIAILATFLVSGVIHEYVFASATGRVRGYQLLFFAIQGMAVAAPLPDWSDNIPAMLQRAITLAFNLSTCVLFFACVNDVAPFHDAHRTASENVTSVKSP